VFEGTPEARYPFHREWASFFVLLLPGGFFLGPGGSYRLSIEPAREQNVS
jgi:hypothetical protein